ncbi:hypothetical protein [Saccharothrix australiensis]|uniref:hypothetical protein n=1 Tax=Saccharothrix australiensis TaxID=2072 RepID=UPI001B86B249|nr:hypothetical protein [Saccharothrix australiensis]
MPSSVEYTSNPSACSNQARPHTTPPAALTTAYAMRNHGRAAGSTTTISSPLRLRPAAEHTCDEVDDTGRDRRRRQQHGAQGSGGVAVGGAAKRQRGRTGGGMVGRAARATGLSAARDEREWRVIGGSWWPGWRARSIAELTSRSVSG